MSSDSGLKIIAENPVEKKGICVFPSSKIQLGLGKSDSIEK